MNARLCFVAGTLAAALGVMAGAFGAHALADSLSPERLSTFQTAVHYQMYHAFGLLFVAWSQTQWAHKGIQWAGTLFLAGLFLFSGSLYVLVLTDTPWLGAVTPLGGLAFIAGWLMLAWGAWKGH